MSERPRWLITGASGNLGQKARTHLATRAELVLLDRNPRGDSAIHACDLARLDSWTRHFEGVDAVLHLAANPEPEAEWTDVVGPNLDGLLNVLEACAAASVRRLVLASSTFVVAGYRKHPPARFTVDLPPRPATPYGFSKAAGERVARHYAERRGISVVALRIGAVHPGNNEAGSVPAGWFRSMWLSNRDWGELAERALAAPGLPGFTVVYGTSANIGAPWDLGPAREWLGYQPVDGCSPGFERPPPRAGLLPRVRRALAFLR